MISFPFDSHVTYTADGAPEYDRAVTSEPYRNLIKNMFTTGINPKDSTAFQVSTSDGMNVSVHGGFAIVEGMMNLETDVRTLAVQASDASYDRIDSVVIRLDDNDDVRTCDLYVLQGTPAETPTRPALTRAGSIYEIGLADLFISKNTSQISAEKITDTRFEAERCGVIAPIAEIDTTTLNKLMEEYQQEYQASFNTWGDEQKEAFKTWLDSMKDILDADTAGHLQTEIEELQTKIDNIELTAQKVEYDNTTSGLEATNVQEAIDGLKKSVSDGKSTVASAITTKGVTTASDATFDTMATNIKNIPNANSDTYTPTSRAILDMGVANKIRYVNTNSVPNTNSATYTPTWNGTHDLGATNTYRYVNTNTIYNNGYNNGKNVKFTLKKSSTASINYSSPQSASVNFSYTTTSAGQFIFILFHEGTEKYCTINGGMTAVPASSIIFDFKMNDAKFCRIVYGTVEAGKTFSGNASSYTNSSYDTFGFYLYMNN